MSEKKKNVSAGGLTVMGVFTAVLCVLAPLSIPIGAVPVSLTNLVLYLSLYVLGTKKTAVSYLIYLLLGLVGLPVFSGFQGGPGRLLGPTGGYLIGFIPMIWIAGCVIERSRKEKLCSVIGMAAGTAVCYAFGTSWLSYQAGMDFRAALMVGVVPFLPGDLLKMAAAAFAGPELCTRLARAGIGQVNK